MMIFVVVLKPTINLLGVQGWYQHGSFLKIRFDMINIRYWIAKLEFFFCKRTIPKQISLRLFRSHDAKYPLGVQDIKPTVRTSNSPPPRTPSESIQIDTSEISTLLVLKGFKLR